MSTRLTVLEFSTATYPTGTPALVRRSLYGTWPGFLSDNGVWPNYGNGVETHKIVRYYTPTASGSHTLTSTCDNNFTWSITGGTFSNQQVLTGNFWGNIYTATVNLVAGVQYTFTWNAYNGGGPAGLAATVTAPGGGNNFNLKDFLGIQAASGRYQVTFPFNASITAHVWGAGGGGGGNDAYSRGGVGSPGLYHALTFSIEKGTTIEIAVGSGGKGGLGDLRGGPPGGDGGNSRTSIGGYSTLSFNGGKGGRAGISGASGAGGGGGGASTVMITGAPIIVAGGGGGGAGAGLGGGVSPHASIGNNVIGNTPLDYRGENGQDKSGDGGGGGAGGGGYPGGEGGAAIGGDQNAYPGETGGNLPVNSASTGVGTLYYKTGFAGGGASGGGNGQNGRIVLEIQPQALNSVKVSGDWQQVTESFVKVGGAWKSINEMQVKVDGQWRAALGSGQSGITIPSVTGNYGTVIRSYS
jgi:hypothetical protein